MVAQCYQLCANANRSYPPGCLSDWPGGGGLAEVPVVAFHGDFSYRNMLVEGEGAARGSSAIHDNDRPQ